MRSCSTAHGYTKVYRNSHYSTKVELFFRTRMADPYLVLSVMTRRITNNVTCPLLLENYYETERKCDSLKGSLVLLMWHRSVQCVPVADHERNWVLGNGTLASIRPLQQAISSVYCLLHHIINLTGVFIWIYNFLVDLKLQCSLVK